MKQDNTKEIEIIQKEVCDYYDIPFYVFKSKSQKREVVNARQMSFNLCNENTSSSKASIGREHNRTPADVLHGIKTIKNIIDTETSYRDDYGVLKSRVKRSLNMEQSHEVRARYNKSLILRQSRSACLRHKMPYYLRYRV